ncbi:MAG: PilC/PilY family type IV pilus protein, partial [Gammaproteobacteria bacterium]
IAVIAASAMLSLSTLQSAYAAPGSLATAPLFLSTIVEPNIYFTVDDSGSMDWNPVLGQATGGLAVADGLPYIDGRQRAYYTPQFSRLYGGRYVVPPADGTFAAWDDGWVVRNHNANLNYYNPSVTYEPWPGTKADGTPMYTDADPKNALKDPFNPGGESVDLTVSYYLDRNAARNVFDRNIEVFDFWIAVYWVWSDTDGNGVVDVTDDHKRVVIPTDSPAEMQNFANWFQYYRSRINAAKSIIGATINNTDASRMGMHQFNEGQLAAVSTMSDPANKRAFLEDFYDYDIRAQGTPMRRGLEDVGQYFDNTGAGNAPILPATDGGECQQNFNIVIGDGYWSGSDPSVGNTDADGGSGDNNSIFDGNASQSNDGGNYADSYDDTLADVAMWDYERDLRPDLADRVPTQQGVDEADHQHLVTYAISFGPIGTLDPSKDDPLSVGFAWPDPDNGDAEKIDDMWHAAYNGRGEFLSADNPIALQNALRTAIDDIAQRTATAAAVSINSARLTTDAIVYLAQFNTNRWQGDLEAYRIVDTQTGALGTQPEWNAADELDSLGDPAGSRVILTHDGTGGVPFQWADLSAAQKDDLKTSPSGGVDSDSIGEARLDYLRGDQSNEGTGLFFRERASLLADLVNSGPVYVGAPSLNWPDKAPFPTAIGDRYSDYKQDEKDREGVIYIGSNGGMLHGFAEGADSDGDGQLDSGGEEVIAYVPANLFSTGSGEGLHYLTDPNYVHKYYVDLTPTISDVYIGGSWKTILIGAERGGGRGLFALDVTDPGAFSENNASSLVLWEFSSADDADLGYTYSRPQIGLANNGKWVAIFGNGYNDTGSGEAKLFIVDIEGAADGSWDSGDIIEITTGSGDTSDRNGLATPSLADLDGDGTIDRVWAGDLKGQLWAFDLTDSSSGNWDVAGGAPLFTTINNEPITSKPALAKHPVISDNGTNSPNVMVYFGSGQYLTNADKSSTDTNYFYGVWDRGDNNITDSSLVQQTFQSGFTDSSTNPARVISRNAVDYAGGDYGWYFELPDSGERSVTSPVVRGGLVFFNSFVPIDDPCSVGGYGFRFAVDMITGGSPDEDAIDVNNDGVIDDNDRASNGITTDTVAAIQQEGFLPEPVFIEDIAYTAETPSKVIKLKNIPKGRFSWQELIQ